MKEVKVKKVEKEEPIIEEVKEEKEIKKEEPAYCIMTSIDNINTIAKKFNITVEKLKELNKDIDINKTNRLRVK